MERAETLVREMEEEGIDATIDIYHTMMDGYTMIGNEDKCVVVFERLKVRACLVSSIERDGFIFGIFNYYIFVK